MLLDRLSELRERLGDDKFVEYHKRGKAVWGLVINEAGKFVGWQSRDIEEDLPTSGRTAGVYAHLFADKLEYLLGMRRAELDEHVKAAGAFTVEALQAAAAPRSSKYLEASAARVEELIAHNPQSPELHRFKAAAAFLRDAAQRSLALEALVREGHKLKENDIVTIQFGPTALHTLPEARSFWSELGASEGAAKATMQGECIVCGEHRSIASLHPSLPLQGSSGPLVSANMKAFESYGLTQSQIAPTCQRCALRYGQAAVYLLKDKRHSYSAGGVTYIFWTRDEVDAFEFLDVLQTPEPEQVRRVLASPHKPTNADALDADKFYAAALTMNMSRPVVRDLVETTLPSVRDALRAWFDGMALWDLSGAPSKPHGVYALAGSTVLDMKKLPPRVMPALIRAALYGELLPSDLLARALQRIGADPKERWTKPRMALVRLLVNDLLIRELQKSSGAEAARLRRQDYINDPQYKEHLMGEELNEAERRPAYLCGRLFATLEEAQRSAMPGINATIADRFFGTASTAPASVFGRLLRGAQAHMQKLERDNPAAYASIQSQLNEITPGISEFPRTLTLKEQGIFALGYYHQRAATSRQIKERSEAKKAREAAKAAEKAADKDA
jgi:CRISPR-associated protein Csd1